jgi:lipid-binding SYLF domain-containing protein
MSSISIGLQLGGQENRFLLILMTDNAVRKVMSGDTQVGGDLSAVAVETGVDKSTGTTTGWVKPMETPHSNTLPSENRRRS